jgi:Ca2+-transporting ATPase
MSRKPRKKTEPILNAHIRTSILIVGFVVDFFLLALFYALSSSGDDITYVRSVLFTALAIDSLLYVFSCRTLYQNILQSAPWKNVLLIAGVSIGVLLQIVALYHPTLQHLLHTVPLRPEHWILILALAGVKLILIEVLKYLFIIKKITPQSAQ